MVTDVRISSLKDEAICKASSLRNSVSDKLASVKPKIGETMSTVKPKVTQMWQRASTKANELRRNPLVLGGLAGAAGLAIGLAGRWLRHRAHAPTLVLIETC